MSQSPELLALRLERDIVSLFHRYASSTGFLDLFEFEELYGLPYWNHLGFCDAEAGRQDFIREGCLMLVLRIALQFGGLPESAGRPRLAACAAALRAFAPGRDRERELAQAALGVLEAAARGEPLAESRAMEINLLEDEVVQAYFRRMAASLQRDSDSDGDADAGEGSGSLAAQAEAAGLAEAKFECFLGWAEGAYERFYSATDHREAVAAYAECKDSMALAIAQARLLGQASRVGELQRRMAHWQSVFRQLWP